MLSVVILTHNEEKNIRKCLESVMWANEILVIDDFSEDKTVREVGPTSPSGLRGVKEMREVREKVKIFQRRLDGDFAGQRNFGLEKAKGEWVLFVDADEEVTEELKTEITSKIKVVGSRTTVMDKGRGIKEMGYFLQRRDIFLGKELRFGETGKIKLLRLGKKGAGEWKRNVHEYWDIQGKSGSLKNPLLHHSHSSIREFMQRINFYSEIDAGALKNEGKSFQYWRAVINPVGKFFQNYFLRLGFLDGYPGLVMAFMMSFQSLVVRVKQYERNGLS